MSLELAGVNEDEKMNEIILHSFDPAASWIVCQHQINLSIVLFL